MTEHFQPIGQAASRVVDRISMQEWDDKVAPALDAIKSNSHWVKKHSQRIVDAAGFLPSKPAFETQAYAELALAEAQLKDALKSVEEAMARYQKLDTAA